MRGCRLRLQELSEPGSPSHTEHMAGAQQGAADDQQLRQLADTMQQQIGALARAVEDLREVRSLPGVPGNVRLKKLLG